MLGITGQRGHGAPYRMVGQGVGGYCRAGYMLALLGGVSILAGMGPVARAEGTAPVFDELINNDNSSHNLVQGTLVKGDLYQKDGTLGLDGVTVNGTLHLEGGKAVFGGSGPGHNGTIVQSLTGGGNGELVSPRADKAPQLPSDKVGFPFQGELMIANGQNRDFSGSLNGNGDLTLVDGKQGLTGRNGVTGVVAVRNGTLLLHDNGVISGGSSGPGGTVAVGLSYADHGHLVLDGPGAVIANELISVGNGDKSYGARGEMGASDLILKNGARVENLAGWGQKVIVGNSQTGTLNVGTASHLLTDALYVGADPASSGVVNIAGPRTAVRADATIIGATGKGVVDVSDHAVLAVGGEVRFGLTDGTGRTEHPATSDGTLNIRDHALLRAGDLKGAPAIATEAGAQGRVNLADATVTNVQGQNLTSKVEATLAGANVFDVSGQNRMAWQDGLTGTGGLTKEGTGTLELTGEKTNYSGATDIRSGTVVIDHAQPGGTVTNHGGALQANGASLQAVVQNAGTGQITDSTLASATLNDGALNITRSTVQKGLTQRGGKLFIDRTTVNGAMRANGGSFTVGYDGATVRSITGTSDAYLDGNLKVTRFGGSSFDGRVSGTGNIFFGGAGTGIQSRLAEMLMLRSADADTNEDDGDSDDNVGVIGGDGSNYTGAISVDEPGTTVLLTGNYVHTPFSVKNSTVLAGTGVAGSIQAGMGGIVAPGGLNEIGTLNATGDLTMQAGSTLRIRGGSDVVEPHLTAGDGLSYAGLKSDMLAIGGKANLQGGTVDLHVQNPSALTYNEAYRIITTKGGVDGKFARLDTNLGSQYAYLAPKLSYGSQDVDIVMARNESSFAAPGGNRNEVAIGHGLDGLTSDSVLGRALVDMTRDQARQALDNLSGELHASIRTALIQDSFYIRNAVLNRLANSDCAFGRNGQSTYDMKTHQKNSSSCATDHVVLWGQAYGGLGHNGGDGNAALMHHNTAGFVMGMDAPVRNSNWRVGGLFSYGHSMFDIGQGRSSSANSNNVTVGGYAGTHWGRLHLRLGAAYSWNVINTRRQIAVGSYGGRASSSYLGGTAQGFAELGYRMGNQRSVFEPFMNVAYVNMQSNAYREHGTEAALRSRGVDSGVTFSTFGFRASTQFNIGRMVLMPHFTGAYRHGFGRLGSRQKEAFASGTGGAGGMDIGGVLLSSNAAVIETGLTAKLTNRLDLDLSYIGQYGNQSTESGATGSVRFSF